jgi:DNA-binding NarL/FixJ family response regulator
MMPLPMVGRAEELAEIAYAWSAVPATVVVTGGAGCGKSLLVSAALDALEPAPATVLSGSARLHSPAPYDWLAAVLSAHPADHLPVPADALAWLAQQPPAPPRRYAPEALLRLAVRTVRSLVGAGPAVIVVEDLHALDPASLNLIAELAAAPELPALLLVTSRPADEAALPQLAARTLARLAGAPGAVRQRLGPLTGREVASLLEFAYGAPVPVDVAAAVRDRSAGNPYLLTELLVSQDRADLAALAALADPAREHPVELTARERQVLACLVAGMSNQRVATTLGISIRTVTVHVSNLLRKTRSTSRTEAALWAVRHRLAAP